MKETSLLEHEMSDDKRYSHLEHRMDKIHDKVKDIKHHLKHEDKGMIEDKINIHTNGGHGDGLLGGGGLLGGLLVGALLRGGLGGYGGYGNGVGVNTGLEVADTVVDVNTLSKLGSIEAEIGITACQTQNAIATNTNALQNAMFQQALATQQGFATTNAAICAVNGSIKDAAYAIQSAIDDDGDKTRALITNNQIADLERQLAVAQLQTNKHELANSIVISQSQTNSQIQGLAAGLSHVMAKLDQHNVSKNVALNTGAGAIAQTPTNNNNNIA